MDPRVRGTNGALRHSPRPFAALPLTQIYLLHLTSCVCHRSFVLRPSQLEYHVPSYELSVSPPSIPLKSTWISSNLYQLRRDFVVILLEVREPNGDEPERWVMAASSRNEARQWVDALETLGVQRFENAHPLPPEARAAALAYVAEAAKTAPGLSNGGDGGMVSNGIGSSSSHNSSNGAGPPVAPAAAPSAEPSSRSASERKRKGKKAGEPPSSVAQAPAAAQAPAVTVKPMASP